MGLSRYKDDVPLVAVDTVLTLIVVVLVFARVYVRISLVKSFRIDDYLIVIALVWALANYGLIMAFVIEGVGKINAPVPRIVYRARANLINRLFQTLTCATTAQNLFSRLSLLYSFRRFTPPERRCARFVICILIILSVAFAVITVFLEVAGCRPFHVLTYTNWFMTQLRKGKYVCFAPREIYFFSAIFNCLFDIILFAFPFVLLGFTDLKRKTRHGLYMLFAFGGIVVIISVIRIIYLYPLLYKWGINKALPALIFSVVECNCIIIAACIPTLRPLYRLIRQHRHIQPTLEEGHHIVNPSMMDNPGCEGTDATHDHVDEQIENMQEVHDIGGRESRNSTKRVRNKLRKKSSRASDPAAESEKDDEDKTDGSGHEGNMRIGIAE